MTAPLPPLPPLPPLALAEKYLPVFQFRECHGISAIAAPPATVLEAVQGYDDRADPLLATLLGLRELPARAAGRLGLGNRLSARERFGFADFLLLEKNETEIAFGLTGRFWRPDFGLVELRDSADFLHFNQAGTARLVLSFRATPEADGTCRLSTETRVHCSDRRSRALFTPYWLAIRLASGLIRRRILLATKRSAEQAQRQATQATNVEK